MDPALGVCYSDSYLESSQVSIEASATASLETNLEIASNQGSLVYGDVASGIITTSGEINTWTFEATAGDAARFDFTQNGPLEYSLNDPNGVPVPLFGIFPSSPDIYGPLDLTESGTYEFQITGVFDESINYEFRLLSVPAADSSSIGVGDSQNGNLETGDSRDRWVLNSPGNDAVVLTFGGFVEPLSFFVVGPDGFPVRGGDTFGSSQSVVTLDAAGDYTIEVTSLERVADSYTLAVATAPAPDVGVIEVDVPVSGELETDVSRDFWTFDAVEGQELLIDLLPASGPMGYTVVDATGLAIGGGVGGEGIFGPPPEAVFIPADGEYTLRIESLDGTFGTYDLAIEESVADSAIAIGQHVEASIDNVDEVDQYTFEGTAGQNIIFDLVDASELLRYRIFAPDMTLLAEIGAEDGSVNIFDFLDGVYTGEFDSPQVTLPETGTYLVEVEGVDGSLPFYSFCIADVPAPDVQQVNFGQPISGSIEGQFSVDVFEFSGTASQNVVIDFQSIEGAFTSGLEYRLEDPAGNIVLSQTDVNGSGGNVNASADSSPITLQDGTYRLVVERNQDPPVQESSLEISSLDDNPEIPFTFEIRELDSTNLQLLTLGTLLTGSIASDNEVGGGTFTITNSTNVSLDFPTISDSLRYSLVGPGGVIVTSGRWTQFGSSNNGPFLLEAPGAYSVLVSSDDGQPVNFELLVEELDLPNERTFVLGDRVTGSFDAVAQQDWVNFDATAGQRIYIDFLTLDDNVEFQLLAPDGTIIVEDSGFGGFPDFTDQGPLTLEQTGDYRITLQASGDTFPTTYSFDLLDVTTEIDEVGINFGDIVDGNIEVVGAEDRFSFDGVDGQELFIDFIAETGEFTWELIAPSGDVEYSVFSSDSQNPDAIRTLRETGQYEIRVRGFRDATLQYQLQVSQIVENIEETTIAIGDSVSGTVETIGGQDWLNFDVLEGDRIFLDFLSVSDTVRMAVVAPDGSVVDGTTSRFTSSLDSGPLTLEQTGTYRIEIEPVSDTFPFNYSFDLIEVTGAIEEFSLEFDEVVNGNIETLGAEDHYNFAGVAGQEVFFDIDNSTASIMWELVGPSGIVEATRTGFSNADSTITLDETGQYQIRVKGRSGSTPSYQLEIAEVAETTVQQLVPGQTYSQTFASPGSENHFEFSISEPGLFSYDFLSQDNGFVSVDMIQPDGTRLSGFRFGTSPFYLETPGDYRLELSASDSRPSYSFVAGFGEATTVQELVPGQTVTSNLGTVEIDEFNFVAEAGAVFELDMLNIDGGSLGFVLLAPSGSIVERSSWTSSSTSIDTGQISLPENGEYRLLFQSNSALVVYQFEAAFGSTDLGVDSIIVPTAAFSGQSITVEWVVTNSGSRPTNAERWTDEVILESVVDGSTTLLGRVANPSFLGAGESYSNIATFSIDNFAFGEYVLVVETDSGNDVSEFEGNNNQLVSESFLIELSPQPDIVVDEVSGPSVAFSGQPVTVSWDVTNQSTAPTGTGSWTDTVYLSADDQLGESDVQLGSFSRPRIDLVDGESYSQSGVVNLPIGVSGDFFFIVVADSNEQLLEIGFEGNNNAASISPTTINLTPPPDLEVVVSDPSEVALASNELMVSFEVTNFGSTDTPNSFWTDNIWLSQDNVLDVDADFLIGTENRNGFLAIGESYSVAATTRLPDGISGQWFVIVASDGDDVVFEVDNDNNIVATTTPIDVESRPADLSIGNVDLPPVLAIGQSLLANWTIDNLGVGDSEVSTWQDQIVLSTNDVFGDDDDVSLGFVEQTQAVAAGDSYDVLNTGISVPDDTEPGNYFVFVVADSNDLIFEDGSDVNNVSAATPIQVVQESANLVVDSVVAPTALTAGLSTTVSWTVRNEGPDTTAANLWVDAIYLSQTPLIDASSILIDEVQHSNRLANGEQYSRDYGVTIPLALSGDWYVVVQTDINNSVRENSDSDNAGASASPVTIAAAEVPDLQVVDLNVPSSFSSGRTVEVSWTVRNEGTASTAGRRWVDSVYLSLNDQPDRFIDRQLGFAEPPTDLAPGDEYIQTVSFAVPAGLSGPFYLIVATDGANVVAELEGENNNANSTPVVVSLPDPVDFVVGDVTIPANAVAGQQITIDYSVENQSVNTAVGSWEDSIFLSADDVWDINDPLIGKVTHVGDVIGGSSYSESLTAALPGVVPGDYKVIIRSDILNQIIETDDANNAGASLDQTTIDFEQIALGDSAVATVADDGSVYYRVVVPAGETLFVGVDSSDASATAEVFVSHEDVPTRSTFDYGGLVPFESSQFVTVPLTEAGTYYILVSGSGTDTGTQSLTTSARILQFESVNESFGVGGNAGQLTIEIDGAKFDRTLTGRLTNASGVDVVSKATYISDSTNAWLTFELQGLDPDDYNVVLENGVGESFEIANGLEVVAGGGAEIIPTVDAPAAVVRGRTEYPFTVSWFNNGINDAFTPVLEVANTADFGLTPGNYDLGTVYRFHAQGGGNMSPPGILRPQQTEQQVFYSSNGPEEGTYVASVNSIYKNVGDAFDWQSEKELIRPAEIEAGDFEAIYEDFVASVGSTVGDFLEMLSRSARLQPDGLQVKDVYELINTELSKSIARFNPSISGKIQLGPNGPLAGEIIRAVNLDNEDAFAAVVLNDNSFLFPVVSSGEYSFEVDGRIVSVSSGNSLEVTASNSLEGLTLSVSRGAKVVLLPKDTLGNAVQLSSAALYDDIGNAITGIPVDEGVEFEGLAPGTYSVSFDAPGFGRRFLSVDVTPSESDSSIVLEPLLADTSSTVRLRVLIDGQAPESEIFSVAQLEGAQINEVFAPRISGNELVFENLPAGTFQLAVVSNTVYALRASFTVEAGTDFDIGNVELTETLDNDLVTSSTDGNSFTVDPSEFSFSDRLLIKASEDILREDITKIQRVMFGPEAPRLMRLFLDSSPNNPAPKQFYRPGSNVSNEFLNHPKSQGFLETAFRNALVELQMRYDEQGVAKEDPLIEETFAIEEILEKNQLSRKIDYSEVGGLPGHIAGGTGSWAAGGLVDSRTITGTIDVRVVNGKVSARSKLKLIIKDSFDFVDGGDGATLNEESFFYPISRLFVPSEADIVAMLRLVEITGNAYGVPYEVEAVDKQRIGSRSLSKSDDHDDEECPNDDEGFTERPASLDPNDILGPAGFGEQNFIAADQPLNYTIRFENDPVFATAPAQVVTVTQQLDSNLDFRTFRVGDFAIGETVIDVPDNRAFYADRIDLTEKLGVFVDVSIGIDVKSGEAFWNFTAIDPETGDVPNDPFLGLLAPNVNSPEGEGFAQYTVKARRDAQTGDVIDAQARIVFDVNDPIDTPPIFNTLDAGKPESSIEALPPIADETTFVVNWAGSDDEEGSAVADYTIYVSADDGPYEIWLQNTNLTSAEFVGEAGRSYAFYSVARDNAGNVETEPEVPDAVTQTGAAFGSVASVVFDDLNANGLLDDGELGIVGLTVSLYEVVGGIESVIDTTITAADGTFQFENLDTSGRYFVEFTSPEGFVFTLADEGQDDSLDSDADIVTGRTEEFSIVQGVNTQWAAGVVQLGEISGFVWRDYNGDTISSFNEPRMPDVTIFLDDNNNGVLDTGETSTLTAADGSYVFTDLRPGRYYVAQILPDDFEQTFPGIAGASSLYSVNGAQTELIPSSGSAPTDYSSSADLIQLDQFSADSRFAGVDGSGYSVVVIDTGIDIDHAFFGADANGDGVADRIVYQYDFADGDNDATDISGHGSNVSSIIGSEDLTYRGIAPGADIIHLKVFKDNGIGSFTYVEQALQWVIEHASQFNIAAVNLSVGDGGNWSRATSQYGLSDELSTLSRMGVISVSAAGNKFAQFDSEQGVAYPAADPNAISVGAVWDTTRSTPAVFGSATDYSTSPDQIASFSQRHGDLIDVFAPGSSVTGANAYGGVNALRGTSQATPFVTGAAVLAQQLANESLGRSLTTGEFRTLLQQTGDLIVDGDDESDNVDNTGLMFSRLNVHALALAIAGLDPVDPGLDPELVGTDEPAATNPGLNTFANQPFIYEIDLGYGQVRDDVNFGIRLINQAPVVDPIADITIDEGEEFDITGTFSDINRGDNLTATVDYDNGDGPITLPLRDAFFLNGSYDEAGVYDVVVVFTDSAGAQGATSFQITVLNVAPVINVDVGLVQTTEGLVSTNTGTFSDLGADVVSLTATVGQVVDNGDGTWSWSLDTTAVAPGTQTIVVTAADNEGDQSTVTFELTVEKAMNAVIGGDVTGNATEDSSVSGVLTISDPSGAADEAFQADTIAATFGQLSVQTDGSWTYTPFSTPVTQALRAGEEVVETFTLTSVDGSTVDVAVTVTGVNDPATFPGTSPVQISEDASEPLIGQVNVVDRDADESAFIPIQQVGSYGVFDIDAAGQWNYVLDNLAADVLREGEDFGEFFVLTSLDGTEQDFLVEVIGANDAAVIGGDLSASPDADSTTPVSGIATVVDIDGGVEDDRFQAETVPGNYGTFEISINGTWSYVLDSVLADSIPRDALVSDEFTIVSVDGTTDVVSIDILGTNTAAVIGGDVSGTATENSGVSGVLTISDVDGATDEAFQADTIAATYGQLGIQQDGNWTYTPYSTPVTQALREGEEVFETFTLTSVDGSTAEVTVTVVGVNDPATFPGTSPVQISEDAAEPLVGQVNVVDRDAGESEIVPSQQNGLYGVFEIDAAGQWSYVIDNVAANVLGEGADYGEFFLITSLDGTEQDFLVEVVGVNDAPVISGNLSAMIDADSTSPISGQLAIVDPDANEDRFVAVCIDGSYGKFEINALGNWNYELDTTSVQGLSDGEIVEDGFTVSSLDGAATETVSITISGVDNGGGNDPTQDVLSFEDVSAWSSNQLLGSEANVTTDGGVSLEITGSNWTTLKSSRLSTNDLPNDLSKMRVDLFVGENQPNQYWIGNLQFYVDAPSANVYNRYVSQIALTDLPTGEFVTHEFELPADLVAALDGQHDDVQLRFALNVNNGSGPYYMDNIRFGETDAGDGGNNGGSDNGDNGATDNALSFEDISGWTSNNSIGEETSNVTDGVAALDLVGSNWTTLHSPQFSTSNLADGATSLSVDLFVGSSQPNQYWIGNLNFYLDIPSAGIYNRYIGQEALTGSPLDQYSTFTYELPSDIQSILDGQHEDVQIRFALNVNANSGPYFMDNIRLS